MKKNVLDYLDEIVKKVPDKIAFANESEGYTFLQVYEMVNKVGTFFVQKGYYKKPVAVLMEKHPKTIMAFWGVIRAGCFYVPIDAKMPKSRIRLILENCKPEWLICDEHTKGLAEEIREESGVSVCEFKEAIEHADSFRILLNDKQNHSGKDNTRNADNTSKSDNTRNADNMCNTENMCLHTDLEEIRKKALDTDPIYIVFTSGSTGVPKGVVANHRSVIDYVEGLSKALEFDENTIFANQSPLYFDACFKEIYPTIKFGATTYFVPETLFMFPTKLIEFLNEKKVNTICWVASALTIVSSLGTFEKIKPKCLRTIAFGSEVFPVKQLNLWQQAAPNATFFNLYGPTEATGMSCYY
ncbi:MAG: AMP-binding protein, partial [Agathobacter sp.]|nr:AMP-binding protein [Agathobacter sp.]